MSPHFSSPISIDVGPESRQMIIIQCAHAASSSKLVPSAGRIGQSVQLLNGSTHVSKPFLVDLSYYAAGAGRGPRDRVGSEAGAEFKNVLRALPVVLSDRRLFPRSRS